MNNNRARAIHVRSVILVAIDFFVFFIEFEDSRSELGPTTTQRYNVQRDTSEVIS